MSRIHTYIFGFMLLALTATAAWGAYPPPPVNQNLGIPDSQFNLFAKEICWRCHKPQNLGFSEPPAGVPVKTTYLPDRHHQHVNTEIWGGPETPPFPDANGDGIEDTHYTCLNCHELAQNPDTGYLELVQSFRDCLFCHQVEGDERTVHHDTPWAKKAQCAHCHGSLIRSYGLKPGEPDIFDVFPDSDTIPANYRDLPPEYPPSIITPWRSGKVNADDSITSSAGTHPGNCNFCHNTADGQLDGTQNVESGFGPITVFTNQQNHHGTGVPTLTSDHLAEVDPRLPDMLGQVCTWCHNITSPSEDQIRGCQNCHDRTSLHNIEADVAGDGIIPGAEQAYNGHIGNTDNCWGCHGNNGEVPQAQSLGISMTTETVPQLNGANALNWEQGTEVPVTLSGSGFSSLNEANRAIVRVTDDNGNTMELVPTTVAPDYIDVTFPSTMAAGNHSVVVWKGNEHSAPLVVSISQPLEIKRAMCYSRYGLVILGGTGLSQYIDAAGSGTSITGDGVGARKVYRWGGGMIAAQFPRGCPSTVEVTNIFDSVTIDNLRLL
ncbi:MAG TPA: hypothetical protein ENI99_01790 [Sedimenticola sp.]|nr:hypothetical protein [Sedimenticola sp.]